MSNALEPIIDARTIEFHYGKHHQAYVTNLNGLVPGTEFENLTLEEIIKKSSGPVFNNAAQVWNHTFYWESLTMPNTSTPSEKLTGLLTEAFGSLEEFKKQFSDMAVKTFGSGWAWLVKTST